jgi:hypothetical protein
LRRLDGVIHVQLDTEIQFARITFAEPTELDFPSYAEAAKSAAYETISMLLSASGTVERAQCERCQDERTFLRLDETGQLLELSTADLTPGEHISGELSVTGWQDAHPRLALQSLDD